MESQKKKYRIMSFDGGPSAIVYLRALQKLEEHAHQHNLPSVIDSADLLVGTSAGSMCALFLAAHKETYPARKRIKKCIEFCDELVTAFKPGAFDTVRLLSGFMSMKSDKEVRSFAKSYLPNKRLSELSTSVCVSAYSVRTPMQVEVMHNLPSKEYQDSSPENLNHPKDPHLVDTMMRSSAFPPLMPIEYGCIDGGFFANNPAMCGLTTYLWHKTGPPLPAASDQENPYFGSDGTHIAESGGLQPLLPSAPFQEMSDVLLLSLGGESKQFGTWFDRFWLTYQPGVSWGWPYWLLQPFFPFLLVETAISANVLGTNFSCNHMLGDNAFRVAYTGGSNGLLSAIYDSFLTSKAKMIKNAKDVIHHWISQPKTTDDNQFTISYDHACQWVQTYWLSTEFDSPHPTSDS